MDIQIAAKQSRDLLNNAVFMNDDLEATTREHIEDMLTKIFVGEIIGAQAQRWLGWAQCAIYLGRGACLEELKRINYLSDKPALAEVINDPVYNAAVDYVRQYDSPLISSLQRHLKVKYPLAAKLIDAMEQDGVVGPLQGKGGREIYALPAESLE